MSIKLEKRNSGGRRGAWDDSGYSELDDVVLKMSEKVFPRMLPF